MIYNQEVTYRSNSMGAYTPCLLTPLEERGKARIIISDYRSFSSLPRSPLTQQMKGGIS